MADKFEIPEKLFLMERIETLFNTCIPGEGISEDCLLALMNLIEEHLSENSPCG